MLIVQKYGGTSLAGAEQVLRAASRMASAARQGNQVVAVVSAQGQTTDEMIAKAIQINPRGAREEMDAYLSAGEQMSAALMAMALGALGCSAVSFTGWQAGIRTDENYGSARLLEVDTAPIRAALAEGKIAVIAGFQGISPSGRITTLGRGGSDTTAVALAAALGADKCQIYTDVDGIYDRDPRRYPDAIKFSRIGYSRMLTLARQGAQVLHDRCIELAQEKKIHLEVLSALEEKTGTIVGQE